MAFGGRRTLAAGVRLDRYELVSLEAEGRATRVWLGRLEGKHGFSKLVAVKTLAPHLATDRRVRAAFLEWMRTLSTIEHPNVVQILDLGEASGVPYVIMEWADGLTLERLAESCGPFPLAVALRIIADACAGLHAAHELRDAQGRPAGVVHGDVSARNVIVTRAGVAKLLDFGIARASEAPSSDVRSMAILLLGLMGVAPRDGGGKPDLPATVPVALHGVLRLALSAETPAESPAADDLQWALESAMASSDERSSTQDVARWLSDRGSLPKRPDASRSQGEAESDGRAAPPPKLERARRAWTAPRVVGATAAALGLAIVAAAIARRAPGAAPDPPPAAGADATQPAAGGGGAVTDLPFPSSSSPEALAAYRKAMQSYRNGSTLMALASFERAVDLDPSLAAAHLRIATLGLWSATARAREHFARASTLRHSLSEHDDALLQAFEPIVQREPSDYAEAVRRIGEARRRFPHDAELALRSGLAMAFASPAAIAELQVATSIDPLFGSAYSAEGEMLCYADRFDDALRTAQACLDAVPHAAQCLRIRVAIEEQLGQCAALEQDARRQGASDPTDFYSLRSVANAVYGQGAALGAVVPLLDAARDRMPPSVVGPWKVEDEYATSVLSGDLGRAELAARAEARLVASDAMRSAHGRAARRLVRVLVEEGDIAAAAAAADDFVRRAAGWQADPRNEDFAIARDPTPVLLGVMRRAGMLSTGELAARRNAWLASMKPADPLFDRYLWAHGWAAPAETEEDAAATVDAQKDYGQAPRFAPETLLAADVGRTYFLAGRRDDESLEWLRRGADACSALDFPVEHVRASLWLGRAFEERGDRDAACRAYAAVVTVWGGARPRSVTAEEARRRARSLGCP